jgi:hypothetical protein
MGRGGGRGPTQLRFRTLLEFLGKVVQAMPDERRQDRVLHSLLDSYLSTFALFFLQDPSVLEFQRRFEDQVQNNNLRTVFGVSSIPSDSRLRELLDEQKPESMNEVFTEYLRRLQRSKHLERYRFLEGRYLLTLDGSEYFCSENVHCAHCLHRKKSDGRVEYYHQILQPALVHPNLHQVLPLAPEFLRTQDGATKQDSETNAAKRAIKRIRAEHRQLDAIIVGDSLYSTMPFIAELKTLRFSFLLVAKPDDHKSLFQDIDGLRRGSGLHTHVRSDAKGKRYRYEWTHEVALGANPKSPLVNFVQLTITDAKGKDTYRCSWVTDLPLTEENIEQVVRAARARWKIENEAFNTLKNQGYHLEHNFGHGSAHLSETFFMLNLLAFFVHQIHELVDEEYQRARGGFGSRKEFWNVTRALFQVLLFNSWDEVLARLTGPPLPAFLYSSS